MKLDTTYFFSGQHITSSFEHIQKEQHRLYQSIGEKLKRLTKETNTSVTSNALTTAIINDFDSLKSSLSIVIQKYANEKKLPPYLCSLKEFTPKLINYIEEKASLPSSDSNLSLILNAADSLRVVIFAEHSTEQTPLTP